jgi:uncharacterized protein YbaP (TraB family)
MKKLLSLSFILLFCSLFSFAQENSVLWKISGNNLKADSYILGTIHIICPADFIMHDKVKRVIGEVDQVVFEVDLFNPENTASMQQKMMTPIPDFLSSLKTEQIQLIDSVLTANQLSIKMFDMLHPSMVMSLLTLKSFNCPNPMEVKSVENEVHVLAEGKNITDLETIDFQLEMLGKIATPEYFYNYLKLYNEAGQLTQRMVAAYNKQDLSILEEVITDPNWMTPEVYDLMLTQRNNRWVEAIPSKIEENKTLIAVGAAHLIGKDGLIKKLREKGYKVTPVLD